MFYITQERAMAPGISGEWPEVIPKPDSLNGRLVKVDGLEEFLREVREHAWDNGWDDWERKIDGFLGDTYMDQMKGERDE